MGNILFISIFSQPSPLALLSINTGLVPEGVIVWLTHSAVDAFEDTCSSRSLLSR